MSLILNNWAQPVQNATGLNSDLIRASFRLHVIRCTRDIYYSSLSQVVLRLQESVCQKDKEKNRRTRTDSLKESKKKVNFLFQIH